MSQDNASFTFLHRIEEVELNIEDGRWQSALALALTLPDICGGIAFPEIVKRYRDGRAVLDRNQRPTRDVGNQYIRWFDTYAAPFFKVSAQDISPYICGERCWQLRCEYLHQNKGFANTEDNTSIRFHLGVNCGTSVCQLDRISSANSLTDIRIDIEQFCRRMCRAVRAYYEAVHTEKDFNLYNTPVLDFIKASQDEKSNATIAIMCSDSAYGNGLRLVLQNLSKHILVFETPEAARKELSKKKPMLWIVTEPLTKQPDQPWRADKRTPVILLSNQPESEIAIEKNAGKLTVLPLPVLPETLRNAVKAYLLTKEDKKLRMIIIIFSLILLLLAYFLYVQKKKVISLQQQISDLQSKISILEKQDLAAEQYNDSLRQEANTVHLYASLSLEETRKTSIKDKQSQIIRSSEHILELLNNEKV